MKYTVQEKYDYNKSKKEKSRHFKDCPFSYGYVLGVDDYKKYPKLSGKDKGVFKDIISTMISSAGYGNEFGKGYACAIRDCANERKGKNKK